MGLPALAMLALSLRPGQTPGFVLWVTRWLIRAAVALLLLRGGLFLAVPYLTVWHQNDFLFFCDVVLAIVILVFDATLVFLLVRGQISIAIAGTLVLVVTAMLLAWGFVPTVATTFLTESVGQPSSAGNHRLISFPVRELAPNQLITADWFYSPNTVSGTMFHLSLAMVCLWAIAAGVFFLFIRWKSRYDASGAARLMTSLIVGSFLMWMAIGFLTVLFTPSLFLYDLFWLHYLQRLPFDTYLPAESPIVQFNHWGSRWLLAMLAALATAFLFASWFQPLSNPLIELGLDSISYFRRKRGGDAQMAQRIQQELCSLIAVVERHHGVAPLVVGHSLGSIIAVAAAASGQRMGQLVTIGSPLGLLKRRYPGMVQQWLTALPANQWRNLSWENIYCACDVVGRELEPFAGEHVTDVLIGDGGHTEYFRDERVAQFLSQHI